jgi:hypothetical protein
MRLAFALLLAAGVASAAPAFSVPKGWRSSPDANGDYLTDGARSITVRKLSRAEVDKLHPWLKGRAKGSRRFERKAGGQDSPTSIDHVYQEVVSRPAREKGFVWLLDFESPSARYLETPRGLDAWKSFQKSFKPR